MKPSFNHAQPMPQPQAEKSAPRLSMLALAVAAALLGSAPLQAAEGGDGKSAAETIGSALDTVIVTGVRGGRRTVVESPAPIDIISADQLARSSGRAELGEALTKLLPSFNFGYHVAGVNSIVRPVSNRGLGPAYTLVLVNGKRRHNSALLTNGGGDSSGVNPVDLDLIPLSAVHHIEVLKDSAAAQYGTDAVAGVVNIVLKRNFGGHVGLSSGRLYEGDGDLTTTKGEADFGTELGTDGFIHFSVDARKRGQSWNNFPATNTVNWSPASNPKNATWNRDGAHNGDPQVEAWNLSYNAELPVNGEVSLYSFGTGGQRDTVAGNNFRRANGLATITQLFPDGYFALNNSHEIDFQFVFGAKGRSNDWDWDLSTSYGKSRNRQFSDLTINPSLGPASPTRFDNLATYQFSQWVNNLDVTRAFDIGLKKPLQVSFGGEFRQDGFDTFAGDPLGYTNGGYVFKAGDQEGDPNVGKPANVGAQAAVVLAPIDEARLKRNVAAAYVDLGFHPRENWFVDTAVRAERYGDSSGNTVSGKLNSRYDLTPQFAVRGTVGSGFRAPSLSQIGYAQTDNRTNTDINGNLVPSLSKLLRNTSPLARDLGAEDLKPEKSTNFGLGVTFQPNRQTSITLDAYRVDIRDRIIRTGYLYGPAFVPLLQKYGYTGSEWVQYFANAVDTKTTGVDLVAETTREYARLGTVRWSAAFNWNKTEVEKIKNTPSAIAKLGANPGGNTIWFPRSSVGGLTDGYPQTKLILGARWFIDRFDIHLAATRYDKLTWFRSERSVQDVNFGAKWITDLDVNYALTKSWKLTVGAANLFNVHPDKSGPGEPTTGTSSAVYGTQPYATGGGFYYGKIAYDF